MFKNNIVKLEDKSNKLTFDKRWELYLYMLLIRLKGIKILKRKNNIFKVVSINKLNTKYEHFIYVVKGQDNFNNNIYQLKQDFLIKKNYLSIVEEKNTVMKLYINNNNIKNKYYEYINNKGKNVIEEKHNDLRSRTTGNKLFLPHYYFTAKYNEKNKSSQVRSWNNSIFNFLSIEKSGIKYLDIYSSKLIKLFFNLKYIQRKKIWDIVLLSGLKIKPNLFIIKDMNTMIKYTSNRSSWSFKNLSSYPPIMVIYSWLLEQIKFSLSIKKLIRGRKEGIISGFKMKKKNYIRKLDKVFISKPLFKHTSFNIIIDLFVYNNKTNKLQKFENILSRRILYKYMYSMYINYSKKVKETLKRPHFFYLNLIEPKTFNYYSNVVRLYENILVMSNKKKLFFLCLLIFKWNYISKIKIQYLKNKYLFFKYIIFKKNKLIFDDKYKSYSIYKNMFSNNKEDSIEIENTNSSKKKIEKNINFVDKNNQSKIVFKRQIYNKFNLNKEVFNYNKEDNKKEDNNNKRINKESKSKYLKYKKYFQELEWKSTTPVDLSKLTLWSKKGLNRDNIKNENSRGKKDFRHNKYSLDQFKRKIYYAKGKVKRKVAPKIWKQQLMSFFLFSRAQKRDTHSNKKIFNLNNKIIIENKNKNKNKISILNKDRINNTNLYNKKKDFYFQNNNINRQIDVKKRQTNMYNNKELIKSLPYKNYISSKKDNLSYAIVNESLSNKKEYLEYSHPVNYGRGILNGLFNNFFILNTKKGVNQNIIKEKKSFFFQLNNNRYINNSKLGRYLIEKKRIKKYNNKYVFLLKENDSNINNSKNLWDKLDYSIINTLNNILKFNNYKNIEFRMFSLKNLYNKIKYIINNYNVWYIYLIKKEFYLINRDIFLSKNINVLPNEYNNILSNNYNHSDNNNIKNLEYNNNNILPINVEANNLSNEKGINLIYQINYSYDIFKPYYRYMIPLFMYKSYQSFISHLGYKNSFFNAKVFSLSKLSWIKTNNITIINFIIVKTLLDLIHYNYRSLIRVKPKYYFLNKLRYYGIKAKRLNFNTWIASVKYIKRLRKTPRHFWLRYHKLVLFYFNRIIQNAELDTKRKILLPFVFYFEDILFNIYGKWVIIRLWPLKRYYLNSYILAERIMLIILGQGSSTSSILEYRQSARNLINILRWSQVNKAYDYYGENNNRWPVNLIRIMKENKSSHCLNYKNLEFFNKKLEKSYTLNTYPLYKARLDNYIPSVKFNYINTFKDNLNNIKSWDIKNKLIHKKGTLTNIRYVYYWLRPLNSYLMSIKNYLDIGGIKFKLTGRPGVIRSNVRSFTKTYFYGNLLGPRHFNSKTLKTSSLSNYILRGTIKSNIDYDFYTSKSNNGSITLKIWMSSLFSSDIHELLLYFLRIKNLYFELVNRHYLVYSKFSNLKYYSLYSKVNKFIQIKKNIKRKKYLKRFFSFSKTNQKKYLPFINKYKFNAN
jgi:hypothetical protein